MNSVAGSKQGSGVFAHWLKRQFVVDVGSERGAPRTLAGSKKPSVEPGSSAMKQCVSLSPESVLGWLTLATGTFELG